MKVKMPKTRKEFDEALKEAFHAGCKHGYFVEHSEDIYAQEELGALYHIGKISSKEMYERLDNIKDGGTDAIMDIIHPGRQKV